MTACMSDRARRSSNDLPDPESSEYRSTLVLSVSSDLADFSDLE